MHTDGLRLPTDSDEFDGIVDELNGHVHSPTPTGLDNPDSYNNNDTANADPTDNDDNGDNSDNSDDFDEEEDPLSLSARSVPAGQDPSPQWAAFEDYKILHDQHVQVRLVNVCSIGCPFGCPFGYL